MIDISRHNMLLLLSFLLLFNCNSNQDSKLEQDIFSSIFNELIDATITDYNELVVPSPSDFENAEAIERLNERIDSKKREKRSPLIVGVNDTITRITDIKYFYNRIEKHISLTDYQFIISTPYNESKESYKINVKTLTVDKTKYELIYESKIPNGKKLLSNTEKNRLSGVYHLSRICFNKEKTLGIFTLSVVYGRLNAYGVIVFVKKKNDKWVVDKIIDDWVS